MNLSRARLLFEGGSYFSAQALRAATIRCAATIRINTVNAEEQSGAAPPPPSTCFRENPELL